MCGFGKGVEFARLVLEKSYDVGDEFKYDCDCAHGRDDLWCRDCVENERFDAEENARQMSDFVNGIGWAMNAGDDPETLWDAYEEGFAHGLRATLDKVLLPDRLFPMATESARVVASRNEPKKTKRKRARQVPAPGADARGPVPDG